MSLWMFFSDRTPAGSQDILLAAALTLTTQWQELRPATAMQASAPWSELLIEIPRARRQVHYADDRLTLPDGTPFDVYGSLSTETGENIRFSKASIARYNTKAFIRLSSSALQWKTRDSVFRSVTLRATSEVALGRVVWMSYDPRTTEAGVVFPKIAQ